MNNFLTSLWQRVNRIPLLYPWFTFRGIVRNVITTDVASTTDRQWTDNGLTIARLLPIRLVAVLCLLLTLSISKIWGYTGTFSNYTNSTLIDGYYVVCGSATAKAMGNTVDGNKRIAGTAVTISSNNISNPADALVFLLEEGNTNVFTFYNYGNSKYLYQASTTSGKGMGFQASAANITLAGYNSSSPVGYKFTLNGASNNFLKWNNSSSWFANYANDYTTSMTPVRLFRLAKFRAKTTQPSSGSFTASATSATWDSSKKHLSWMSSGATVTLTATPPSGKIVSAWTVTKATGGTVTTTSTGDNTATFTMPADQVKITVTWKDIPKVSLTKAGQTNGSFF